MRDKLTLLNDVRVDAAGFARGGIKKAWNEIVRIGKTERFSKHVGFLPALQKEVYA